MKRLKFKRRNTFELQEMERVSVSELTKNNILPNNILYPMYEQ